MAKSYIISSQAKADIKEIWAYIARDNVASADKVLEEFYDAFRMLAEHPLMGHKRDDLTSRPLRFWPVYSYLVIYAPRNPIEIVHVISGYRDLEKLLDGDL